MLHVLPANDRLSRDGPESLPDVAFDEPALPMSDGAAGVMDHFQTVMQHFLDTQTRVMLAYLNSNSQEPDGREQPPPARAMLADGRVTTTAPARPAVTPGRTVDPPARQLPALQVDPFDG